MVASAPKLVYEECERRVVRLLAGNDEKIRRLGLKKFKMLVKKRPSKCAQSMVAYWKGLHYCMWMCPKPIPQEDLADELCSLLNIIPESFSECQKAFIHAFFETQAREWFTIDQHRINKYSMLVRRFFRRSLDWLSKASWNTETVKWFCFDVIQKLIYRSNHSCIGLQMFMTEIIFDELKLHYDEFKDCEDSSLPLEFFVRMMFSEVARTDDSRQLSHFCHEIIDQFILGYVAFVEEKAKEESTEWGFPLTLKRVSEILFEEASSKVACAKTRKRLYNYVKRMEMLSTSSKENLEKKFWKKVNNNPGMINLRLDDWIAPKKRKLHAPQEEKSGPSEVESFDVEQASIVENTNGKSAVEKEQAVPETEENNVAEPSKKAPIWSVVKNSSLTKPKKVRKTESLPMFMSLETVPRAETDYVPLSNETADDLSDKVKQKMDEFVSAPPAFFKGAVEKASKSKAKRKSS